LGQAVKEVERVHQLPEVQGKVLPENGSSKAALEEPGLVVI
jgi:hypothetical protein